MKYLIEEANKCLPLTIENSEWDGLTLFLSGNDWRLSTQSPWRIVRGNEIVNSSDSENPTFVTDQLKSLKIVSIASQGRLREIDPAFEFSNGLTLEVFATSEIEPWIMRVQGAMFVGGWAD